MSPSEIEAISKAFAISVGEHPYTWSMLNNGEKEQVREQIGEIVGWLERLSLPTNTETVLKAAKVLKESIGRGQ